MRDSYNKERGTLILLVVIYHWDTLHSFIMCKDKRGTYFEAGTKYNISH